MLGRKVTITTPHVKVRTFEEFDMSEVNPAVGVEITYVTGLDGNNLMLLKRDDVRKILEILMYTEIDPETFELDELSLSAVCELMNQMMGASSTALASMLRHEIDISIPKIGLIKDTNSYKDFMYGQNENVLTVTFTLEIKDFLTTNFITVMSHEIYDSILEQLPILHA